MGSAGKSLFLSQVPWNSRLSLPARWIPSHSPVPVWQQDHLSLAAHRKLLLAVSSSPPPGFVCSEGPADRETSSSLCLCSVAAAAAVRCVAAVTGCSSAPGDRVPSCSGQGPAEQPRTTTALGKRRQKRGFTGLWVRELRQKSCLV